ncbi:hypothetical protein [Convivina praedatoris]|uniref:hypothetical protein n=1 Tax=Convivina praedatoris TaxID=2880963 RepID=UPI00200D50C9|nr:hypothetical protein [Convivina sp. LMG 32447]CAH1855133.1 hypothetical protein R078138_01066 [Convivina sp. LMG 32447]
MINWHVMPEEYEAQDYYLMLEVMSAQAKEDRPQGVTGYLQELGIDPNNVQGTERRLTNGKDN